LASAAALSEALRQGAPSIWVLGQAADEGYLLLERVALRDDEMGEIVERLSAWLLHSRLTKSLIRAARLIAARFRHFAGEREKERNPFAPFLPFFCRIPWPARVWA